VVVSGHRGRVIVGFERGIAFFQQRFGVRNFGGSGRRRCCGIGGWRGGGCSVLGRCSITLGSVLGDHRAGQESSRSRSKRKRGENLSKRSGGKTHRSNL